MLTSRYASRDRVRRGLVAHPHGVIHFRWAGAGPPLVALHESPRSSLSLLPLVDGLADRRTVIALDTPGYGHSDALPLEVPEGEHFAAAFASALAALGLAHAPLYATHTGAALAVRLALARPGEVAALLLDGFAAFTPAERQDFVERYLAPFEPSWDGAHLAQLWSRCKDLYTWFPYHRRDPATRLAFDPPSVDKLHNTVLGFLMAGPGYVKGYRCAATLDSDAALAALRVPTTITARPHDLICSHLDRVTPTAFVAVRRIGPSPEEWLRVVDDALPANGTAPDLSRAIRARCPDGWDRILIELGAGYLHALDHGTGDEADVVLPDVPDMAARVARTLGTPMHRTIVIDPPGCGASDPAAVADGGSRDADRSRGRALDAAVAALRAALDALGLRRCRVVGQGLGAVLAARLAAADPRVACVAGCDLPGWARGVAPVPAHPVVPAPLRDAEGAALFTTWYRLRDRFLYDDAGATGPVQRTARLEAPSPAEIHACHAALWIGPEAAQLAADLQDYVRSTPGWHRAMTRDAVASLASLLQAPAAWRAR
jgi:pimeloyl-ACP methyl ester carboxylesterase